jgi:maltooligosyltrehalose synthase
VAPRLVAGLLGLSGKPPLGSTAWEDTRLVLPKGLTGRRFVNLFTGAELSASDDPDSATLPVADALLNFPIAALSSFSPNH